MALRLQSLRKKISHDKISMSISSTDKYTYIFEERLFGCTCSVQSASIAVLNFECFFVVKIQFLAKYCMNSMHVVYFAWTYTQVSGRKIFSMHILQSGMASGNQTQCHGTYFYGVRNYLVHT